MTKDPQQKAAQELEAMLVSLKENYRKLMEEVQFLSKKIEAKKKNLKKQKPTDLSSPKLAELDAKTRKAQETLTKNEAILAEMKALHKQNIKKLNAMIIKVREIESKMGKPNSRLIIKRVRAKGKTTAVSKEEALAGFRDELKEMLGEIEIMRQKRSQLAEQMGGLD